MKKIFINGFYGANNLGDDYIMYSLVDNLSQDYNLTILAQKRGGVCSYISGYGILFTLIEGKD